MNSPPAGGGVPASPHPMPFPHAREGNLEPPLSTRERCGGEGFAGGVVGARRSQVTTPFASHPPRPSQLAASSWAFAGSDTWSSKPRLTLEKEGSKAGPVILLVALRDSRPLFSVLFSILFARRHLRIGRQRRWVARVGFSFPLLFLSPLFSEVSLALCKRIVWFYQLATLSIEGP